MCANIFEIQKHSEKCPCSTSGSQLTSGLHSVFIPCARAACWKAGLLMLVCGAKCFYKETFKGLGPSVCMPGPPLVCVCVCVSFGYVLEDRSGWRPLWLITLVQLFFHICFLLKHKNSDRLSMFTLQQLLWQNKQNRNNNNSNFIWISFQIMDEQFYMNQNSKTFDAIQSDV